MAEETKKTVKKTAAKKTTTKKAAPKKEAVKKVEKEEVKEEVVNEVKDVKTAKKEAKAEAKAAKKAAKEEAKAAKVTKVEEKAPVTEARCFARDVRITPRKVRFVADAVRGKDVSVALGILSKTNKVAAAPVAKAIKSAAANAVNNFGMDKSSLYVAEIQVSDGLKIKRFIPRAKGSASPIIKRNANLLVVVKERN
ncbi:MAG: 50S ribosomal protein L22 [Bacillales bacterium]|nr:50S ribosomal protein L22 [Bacillales bacterium]